ncbi:hypothetical protein QSU92_02605 [Microbacterium sp. ET2]|uniref:hypothetical protein n=1 Tax=Microbacterium albipurpureum TaxID=3050384 RepID=UPI00259C846F|nr:hypothetical protein [Microbacterium sp. ET2 (Ac-2212)]WJL96118.1 hypothetical protein QSU92_02605 [Microbacterium sp. ET2 (Ac-2212)]
MPEDQPRQRIERVPGSRRARLTPAPDTVAEPASADESEDAAPAASDALSGPNDERMLREKPPHY